jgi:hypothetical protein
MGNSTHLGNLAKAEKDGVFDATMAYAWASDATAWEHCIEFAGVNEANAHAVLEMIQQLEEAGFSAMPNACKYMIAAAKAARKTLLEAKLKRASRLATKRR